MEQLHAIGKRLFPHRSDVFYAIEATPDIQHDAEIIVAYILSLQQVLIYIKDAVLETGSVHSR